MANLKRYNFGVNNYPKLGIKIMECEDGQYVKFEDIKELLNTSTNSTKTKCPCCNGTGEHIHGGTSS